MTLSFDFPWTKKMGRAVALVCLFLLFGPFPSQAQGTNLLSAQKLEGTIRVLYSGKLSAPDEGGRGRSDVSFQREAVHTFWMQQVKGETQTQGDITWVRGHVSHIAAFVQGTAIYTDNENGGTSLTRQKGSVEFSCPGGGDLAYLCTTGAVFVYVDSKTHTYGFTFNSIPVPATISSGGSSDPCTVTLPGFELGQLSQPAPGARLVGTRTIPVYALQAANIRRSRATRTVSRSDDDLLGFASNIEPEDLGPTVTVTWDIGPPKVLEVKLEPQGYEAWWPEGNVANPDQPGNDISIQATLQRRDDPSATVDKKVKITFNLEKISSELGVCMNWPPNAVGGEGLRFDKDSNPGFDVSSSSVATMKSFDKKATIKVSAFDFGGWGRLRAKAVTEDGEEVRVIYKDEENPSIPLPDYRDNDHIPVSWLRIMNQLGKGPDADDDNEPYGNGQAGDGLTIYEEYRGFVVQGKHIRTDPRRKDLFICDDTGGLAQASIGLFIAASNLDVHVVTREELGDSRVINRNHTTAPHAVDQHGILIKTCPGGCSPEAVGGAYGPPGMTQYVQIPPDGRYAPAPGKAAADDHVFQTMVTDIVHELGHCVNMQHHGEGLFSVFYSWRLESGAWVLYENGMAGDSDADSRNRRLLSKETPVRLVYEATGRDWQHGDPAPAGFEPMSVGSGSPSGAPIQGWATYAVQKASVCSGDTTCYMSYGDKGVYYSDADPAVRYIPDPAQWQNRSAFCTDPHGTGMNAPGHRPQSRYGDAAPGRGNCAGRLLVNDRYAGH